jgi:hypothetical protein
VPPKSPGQQCQAGYVLHGAEVGGPGPPELVAGQRRVVCPDNLDPAP